MIAYNPANDQSSFTFKIFFAGEMVDWLTDTDPKVAMKRAVKMMAKRKDQRKGSYVLFRPSKARPGDEAAALAYSRTGATTKVANEKRLEDCNREELRRAAKHCGLDERGAQFMDYIYGDANQTTVFDKKVVMTLKKFGYSRVVYETPSWMTVK
jgi:hypothetical protein